MVLSVALAAATSASIGGATLAICLAAIYLRGNPVPAPLTLANRHVSQPIDRLFDHRPASLEADPTDLEALLRELDVVTDRPGEDGFRLTDAFRGAWRGRMAAVREDGPLEDLAVRLDLPAEELTVENREPDLVSAGGDPVGTRPSEAALIADLAAAPLLDEYSPEWQALHPIVQGRVLTVLWSHLPACPACAGPVTGAGNATEDCCTAESRGNLQYLDCGAVVCRGGC